MEKRGSIRTWPLSLTPMSWCTGSTTAFPRSRRLPLRFSGAGSLRTSGDDSVRLPHQAIVEFVAAVTRPIRGYAILKQADALREAEEFLKQFTVL
jgi:hypothetical protein